MQISHLFSSTKGVKEMDNLRIPHILFLSFQIHATRHLLYILPFKICRDLETWNPHISSISSQDMQELASVQTSHFLSRPSLLPSFLDICGAGRHQEETRDISHPRLVFLSPDTTQGTRRELHSPGHAWREKSVYRYVNSTPIASPFPRTEEAAEALTNTNTGLMTVRFPWWFTSSGL